MKSLLSLLLAIALLIGCRTDPDFDQLSSDFIVSTSLDKAANFGGYKTYYISDTITYIGGDKDKPDYLVGPDAAPLIKAVKDNMAARGYTFVAKTSNPDIGLSLSAVKNINVVVDYWPGWWDGYWPWCYWSCYPYYYPWTTVYAYTTGTVILNMYDVKNAPSDGKISGIWNTTALGALGSTSTVNTQLGVDALNQGFEQSPYLKAN